MSDRPLTIVTGASRGIGRAIALGLAKAGHDLALLALERLDTVRAVAEEARRHGIEATAFVGDVAKEASIDEFFAQLGDRGDRLYGLVNNAGTTGERDTLANLSVAEIDAVLAVNLRGAILMSRAVVPRLRAMKRGAIVNMSSQSAQFGGNGLSIYAATKAALNGLTVALARELAPDGLRVNAVSPGPVLTEPLRALPPARLAEMQASLPMGRFCTEEEVAGVVAWLLSDEASYVSGAIVPVHGAR
jgi:NAD(P)-dependent dehydrogenase (short-subunit alcohol dehydrogenase family)